MHLAEVKGSSCEVVPVFRLFRLRHAFTNTHAGFIQSTVGFIRSTNLCVSGASCHWKPAAGQGWNLFGHRHFPAHAYVGVLMLNVVRFKDLDGVGHAPSF